MVSGEVSAVVEDLENQNQVLRTEVTEFLSKVQECLTDVSEAVQALRRTSSIGISR